MARITSAVTFLLALAFCAEVMGYHARPLNTLLGIIFLAIFLWPCLSQGVTLDHRRHWHGWLLSAVAAVGFFCTSGWASVLFISLLIGGMRLSQSADGERHPDLAIYQTTAFSYGMFLWFWRETATGWYILDSAARGVMWFAHHLGANATLGPTALGLPVTVLLFLYGASCVRRMPKRRLVTLLKLSVALLVVQVAFVAIHDVVSAALSVSFVQQRSPGGVVPWYPFSFLRYFYPNDLQGIVFVLGLLATFALAPRHLQSGSEEKIPLRRWVVIAGVGALLVGAGFAAFVPPRPAAHGRILICDDGHLDFRVPVFGAFGHRNSGMFGRLPSFLEDRGYQVARGSVSRESLRSASALVVINPMDKFAIPAKNAIWNFVRRGGGLLVLGDHTCTHNIREPINDLLDPVNIELNFDSAKPFRDGWLWAFSFPRHPTTMGMDDAMDELQIWIGASLTIAPPARPVVVGTYGFSDPGDTANAGNGHLGNLMFDPGENLGDLPLVAESRYGRGKVLVFGDTSSLQNDALVSSHQFAENVFAWICTSNMTAADPARRCAAALLILAGMILLAKRSGIHSWQAVAAAVFLLGWTLGAVPGRVLAVPSAAHKDIAWIDGSHLERFSFNNWNDDGTGGLELNLMRNGYSPLLMKEWDTRALNRGSLLILIGPSKPFTRSEVTSIRQFVARGGHLILSAGWEDLSGSKELWREFGLHVVQRPLGRVLVKQPDGEVRLYKGWSIKVDHGSAKVLCSPWGYPAIVQKRLGKGSVVAIADTQFLLDRNVEGTDQYYPENIGFLHRLFSRLKRNGAAASDSRSQPVESGIGSDAQSFPSRKGGQ